MGILKNFFSSFSNDLAIDLGTANTLVFLKGKGIVLNEPSVVAIRTDNRSKNKILAVGNEAKEMLGKTPGYIDAIRPMQDGVIADFDVAEAMLKYFIQKSKINKYSVIKPRVIIAVPSGITQVEKRAVKDSTISAGAREVYLLEEPMAAAIGANLPIAEPTCNMIVDIGGGTTEIAVISLSGTVYAKSLRIAGNKLDVAIQQYVKKEKNLLIGNKTAEMIKKEVCNITPDNDKLISFKIKGRSNAGIPETIEINSSEVKEAISEQIEAICVAVEEALEQTPPELAADIIDNGITLTGGGALLKNFDKLLQKRLKLNILIADNPLETVALGAGKALENFDLFQKVFIE